MPDTMIDHNSPWVEVVAHVERITGAVKQGLRSRASMAAISDSCASEAFREIVPDRISSDEARRLHLVAKYAAGLALARYGELFPHDRAWLEEQVRNA